MIPARSPAGKFPFVASAAFLCVAGVAWTLIGRGRGDAAPAAHAASATPAIAPEHGDCFEDVASAAGLAQFVHDLADRKLSNIIEAVGAGGAFLDYDGDGRLDLYLVQGAPRPGISTAPPDAPRLGNKLYRNRPDGTFADVTREAGVGHRGFGCAAVAADYDNDGDTDLYVVNVGPNVLYQNRGDGSFRDATRQAGVGDPGTGVGAVFFDADRDGHLDLFVANYLSFDPSYRHHYGPDAYPGPLAYDAQLNVLYRSRGDGSFEDVSERAGIRIPGHRAMAVAAFDHDRDGDQDLYVTNDATPNLLLVNDGTGRFRDEGLSTLVAYSQTGEATASMAVDIGDCNGDGSPDILVTDTSYGSLYLATAGGVFEDRVMAAGVAALTAQYVSWGGNFIDFDNDGDLDLFIANGDLHYLVGWEDLLLENLGNGSFQDAADRGGAYFKARLRGRGSAVADYDNDGDLDLLVTNLADRPVLLRNRTGTGNHWLTLDLEGTQSNRDGFGAVVTVIAGGRTLVAEARCPTGYLCQGDGRLHFGLGTSASAERISIRWPSGVRQQLQAVRADRIVTVQEPEDDR